MHFVEKVIIYIHTRLRKREMEDLFKRHRRGTYLKSTLRRFRKRISDLRELALFPERSFESPGVIGTLTALEWNVINEVWNILPDQAFHLQQNNSDVRLDVATNPVNYVGSYMALARLFEQYGMPLFNAIPLRRSHAQSYVTLDSKLLTTHLIDVEESSQALKMLAPIAFDGTIATDGIGVSVMLKSPLAGRVGRRPTQRRGTKARRKAELKALYIDHPSNLQKLRAAAAWESRLDNIILIDPGTRNLLYMKELSTRFHADEPRLQPKTMRYTSPQRSSDTNATRMRQTQNTLRETATVLYPPEFIGPHQSIMNLESSAPSHVTMVLNEFMNWLIWQADFRTSLRTCYNTGTWNKMRFDAFRRRQHSEDSLIIRMHQKFGSKLMVVMGDWSSNTGGWHKRFHAPTKVAGFRKLFKKHHIPCFLLDEFRTSSYCPWCNNIVQKNVMPRRLSPRPWMAARGQMTEVFGLLGCPTCADPSWAVNPQTGTPLKYWNRGLLATRNFDLIVRSMIDGNGRPAHLRRSE
ncbi:hypothetical protein DFJ77DRAFT_508256 [Powellomyces hirtus]|nr:hypothetical protein DFJ77DRAFT_508256 [Powellomyces hirtus]